MSAALDLTHGAFVYRSLRQLGVRNSDLDDAWQEVFLVMFRRQRDYQERGRARSWIYSICRRIALSQRRRYRAARETALALAPELSTGATQLEHVEDRETLELGWQVLQRLTADQRRTFLLYEVEGLAMTEVARRMQCPLQTAYARLHRARTQIVTAAERIAAQQRFEACAHALDSIEPLHERRPARSHVAGDRPGRV